MRRSGFRIPVPLLGCVLLAATSPARGFEWPLDQPLIAATFGTAARGRIVTGLYLATGPAPVRAGERGELLFATDGAPAGSLPSTLGAFVAVRHGDGVVSVYSHLAPGSEASWLADVAKGESLGTTGESGWIEGPGLSFSLYDLAASRWVNPLLFLEAPVDRKAPTIRGASLLADGQGITLGGAPGDAKTIAQGRYRIVVDCIDPVSAPWSPGPSAPYYIRLVVDGELLAELAYDVAETRGGALGLFAAVPRGLQDLTSGGAGITVAERGFSRGKSVIEVLVRDRAGNERRASWAVVVQ